MADEGDRECFSIIRREARYMKVTHDPEKRRRTLEERGLISTMRRRFSPAIT